jgi:hypothetical protein
VDGALSPHGLLQGGGGASTPNHQGQVEKAISRINEMLCTHIHESGEGKKGEIVLHLHSTIDWIERKSSGKTIYGRTIFIFNSS